MRTCRFISLFALIAIFAIQGFGQGKIEKKTDTIQKQEHPAGDIITDQGLILTSRSEDIQQLEKFQMMFNESVKKGKSEYTVRLHKDIIRIFETELRRSYKNIEQMKAGDIASLEEWQEENRPGTNVNVNLEIQILENRINYEKSVYKLFKEVDVKQLKDDRNLGTVVGYVNGFRRAMIRSLKYGAGDKFVPKTKTGGSKKSTGETGFITEKGSKDEIKSDDPRIASWEGSAEMRTKSYKQEQSAMEKAIESKDDRKANSKYRTLIGLMQDEINSNNWMLGMINAGTIDKNVVDSNQLSNKLKQQQSLLQNAQNLLFSSAENIKANAAKAIQLVNQFAETMK